jgi:Ran GTPase-activating protein (RanGAP) involved in mRNA processing and transport
VFVLTAAPLHSFALLLLPAAVAHSHIRRTATADSLSDSPTAAMSQRQESDDADHSGDSSARSGQGAQPRSQPQFQTQLQPHPQFQPHCSQPSAGDCSGGDESTRGGDNGPHQSANQQATTSATAAEDRPARAPALDSIAASDSPSVLGDDDPRNGRTPAVADVAAVSPFSRLATVELQLIMRCCDQFTLLALARCSRFTLAAASHPFVWQPLSPIALRCDWPLELSGRLRAEKSLLRHADISVTWRPWPKAAMSAEQVNSLAALPRLRGLTVESSYDFATDRHTQLSDEGAALLFQSLSERIDHGGALASLSFIGIKIGQAGVASLATFIVRSRSLASLKIIYASNALLASLSASMAQCRTLTSLELHSQSTGSSIVTDRALMSFLQNTSLATLKLRDLRLGDTAVVVLAAAVAQSRSLTDLQLRKTHIGNAGIEALAAALEQSGRICTLDLSRDSLDTAAAAALARLLASDCCALTSLNLSGSQIGHEGVLAEALQTNRSLTELRLCANEMGGQGTAAVAAALRRNPHCRLLVLGLSENRIDLPTAAALAEAMRRSGAFERLEVSECSLTDEGLATLAAGISHSHSLQHLDLVRNSFGAAGAAALASAVATCPALTWLDVRHNKIGDEGLAALAPALQLVPVRLRTLMLSSCGLTQSSAGPLAELIQSSRVLEYLDIDGNSLETQGVAEIAAALQPSSSLRVLRVRTVCGIGARGTAAVAAALSRGWKASKLRLQCGGPTDSLGALALAAAMEELGSRCTLTSLSLSGRGMTAAGTLALVRAATHAPKLQSLDFELNAAVIASDRPALVAACGPQPHFELRLTPYTW